MCGRLVGGHYTQRQMLAIMEHFLYGTELPDDLSEDISSPNISYNVKPTQQIHFVCRDDRGTFRLMEGRWWFVPHWHRKEVRDWKATTFNAKIETAREKPTFRDAWKQGRCLVPFIGFYEWSGPKGKRVPHYTSIKSNQPVSFMAGLYSTLADGSRTVTILTRETVGAFQEIHSRMPVVLHPDEVLHWLDGTAPDEELIRSLGVRQSERFETVEVQKFKQTDDHPGMIVPVRGVQDDHEDLLL